MLILTVPPPFRSTIDYFCHSNEYPECVARQMDHNNTKMLFTVYSKYVPNLTRKDGSAFAQILKKKLNENNILVCTLKKREATGGQYKK